MNLRTVTRATASSLVLSAALLAAGSSAFAQDATSPAPTSGQAASPLSTGAAASQSTTAPGRRGAVDNGPVATVDAIVVTAQKRTQSLQDVPVVVTTVSRQLLQDTGVRDIKDLALLTPGLTVTTTTNESVTSARIRGIGTVGDNVGLESSVGVVIDGVYRPRNGVGFGDLGDVDRIEVLKGPQGTLFGKSTSAGVINVITAQPSFAFHAGAEFTAGNYGTVGGAASVTGPLMGETLAGSLYFADRERDGFYKVSTKPGPRTLDADQNRNFYTFRGQLLYVPDSQLSVRLIADYTHRDESCCAAVPISFGVGATVPIISALGGAGGGEGTTINPYKRQAYANRPNTQNTYDEGVSAEVNYKLPNLGASITSITAYRDWKSLNGLDADFTTADLFYRPADNSNSNEFRDFSEELRFAGTAGKLDYLVGGFYSNENLRSNFSILYGNDFTTYLNLLLSRGQNPGLLQGLGAAFHSPVTLGETPGQGEVDRYRQQDDTYAVFTNDTLHVTSKFDINVGLRYTDDEKRVRSVNANTPLAGATCGVLSSVPDAYLGPLAAALPALCLPFQSPVFNNFVNTQKSSETELSGTAKALYRFNPQLLTYGSYARGYKAGGFNLDRVGGGPAPGVGLLPAATNTSFPGEFVNSYELGAKSTLLDRTLILNATLFYADYTGFQLNTFTGLVFVVQSIPVVHSRGVDADFVWLPMRNLSFQGGLTVADTRFTRGDTAALNSGGGNIAQLYFGSPGARLPLAPLYSASASGTYTYNVTDDFMARFNLGVKYSSGYNTGSDEDPRKYQKGYPLFNTRLALGPRNSRWAVELWAENLLDQHYTQVAFDNPYQNFPTNPTGVIDAFLGQPRTYGVTLRAKY